MKNMYIRIPDELHARVKERAAVDGVSMNHIAVQAISSYLESIILQAHFHDDEYDEVHMIISGFEVRKLEGFIRKFKEDQWRITGQPKDG